MQNKQARLYNAVTVVICNVTTARPDLKKALSPTNMDAIYSDIIKRWLYLGSLIKGVISGHVTLNPKSDRLSWKNVVIDVLTRYAV